MTWRVIELDFTVGAPDPRTRSPLVRACDLCREEKIVTHAVTESEDGVPGMWDWTVCSPECAGRALIQAAIIGEPPWA